MAKGQLRSNKEAKKPKKEKPKVLATAEGDETPREKIGRIANELAAAVEALR